MKQKQQMYWKQHSICAFIFIFSTGQGQKNKKGQKIVFVKQSHEVFKDIHLIRPKMIRYVHLSQHTKQILGLHIDTTPTM